MALIYRAMTRDGDRPETGTTARTLGVRIPGDVQAPDGYVLPATGGMSVAPAWRYLPPWRIPKRLRHLAPDAKGSSEDVCWRMGEGPFETAPVAEGLDFRPDGPNHGLVEPSRLMTAEQYLSALADTRNSWRVDEA